MASIWLALIGLIVGIVNLCRIVPSTFAFDKPLLTASTCLGTLGFSLIALGRFLRRKDGVRPRDEFQYEILPGDVWQGLRALRSSPAHARHAPDQPGLRQFRITFVLLLVATCLRIQLFIRVLAKVECSTYSLEPLVPFVLAAGDYWAQRLHHKQFIPDGSRARAYDDDAGRSHRNLFRRLLCAALFGIASIITLILARGPASTYICPAFLNPSWLVPSLQLAGTATDVLIIYCIIRLLINDETQPTRSIGFRLEAIGKSFSGAALVSAAILIVQTIVYYFAFAKLDERTQMFRVHMSYTASALELNLTILVTALCAIFSMLHVDVAALTLISGFSTLCAVIIPFGWDAQDAFIPKHASSRLFAFGLAFTGFGAYFHYDTTYRDRMNNDSPLFRRRPVVLYAGLLILFLSQFGIWLNGRPSIYYGHHIQPLILNAGSSHAYFMSQASSSRSLSEAVKTYKERYSRPPPPGFDKWYEYATKRSSVIIDDFDSIDRDLLAFRALKPDQIRERTWQIISNPWHEASGIMIRNGKLSIAPNVMPTHRWMLEGVVGMINPFAESLPDMDLAFNVNDEPRVAVPYEVIQPMKKKATRFISPDKKMENSFSTDRAQQWKTVFEQPNEERFMTPSSGRNTFQKFGSVGCPPDSPARTQRVWDVSRLCTKCVGPQSHARERGGGFLYDWKLAGDVCHQPDLAHLHGLYISPAAFRGTHELYPIFSQSKVHGFNDILYPSAWNYIGKSKYEPTEEFPDVPFSNKNHSIYWRGTTTEGISHDSGHWKGMARQRFIHMVNDIHHRSPSQPLLIPHDPTNQDGSYHWQTIPTPELQSIIPTSINFVNEITRCNGLDCLQQEQEFVPLAPRSDFQGHWQYKYLLDLDGAGFSGRFLPFLHSRSLPFKAALYREWWDDRVRAWHHFVPLDLRGHGFWATLAYFAGWEGPYEWRMTGDGRTKEGRLIREEPRNDVAEKLAENGREWARVALRREDMEIYMFRLLLEWGRLTDDRREEIGFDEV